MDCGRCVEACPQGIAIPDELRKASKDLDGFSTRLMYPFVKAVLRRERME
jgi:predicted aldo/keto reductase-like oxidoreductase